MLTEPVRRLLGWLRPFGRGILLSVALGALTIGSSVALMATSAWMISKAALQPSIAELSIAVVGVRFFGITRGLMRYLERLASHEVTFQVLAHMRTAVYAAIEPLAPARLTALRSGDLLGRAVDDVDSLQNIYLRAAAPPAVAVLIGLLLAGLLAAFDPLVALVAAAWFVGSAALLIALARWLGGQPGQALVAARSELNASLVETFQGLPDLQAFGAVEGRIAQLNAQAEHLAAEERRFARLDALQAALMVALPAGAMLSVLALAVPRVDGILLATMALSTVAAFEAVIPLGQAAASWAATLAAAGRLFSLMDTPPAVSDPAQPSPSPETYDLVIEGLSFRYAPDLPPALDAFSAVIGQGERVAIIGESGAGKSTLASLLVRFYEYEQGNIRIGGTELRSLPQAEARRIFSLMSQRTHLFNTSLLENIRIAQPEAPDADVIAAAQAAQIHDFIQSLPEGYDTLAGEDGARLSGGQRQRIALARALLKQSPVLILDEATAHLDAATERDVMQAVLRALGGRTLIAFTHNPALLPAFDRVIRL